MLGKVVSHQSGSAANKVVARIRVGRTPCKLPPLLPVQRAASAKHWSRMPMNQIVAQSQVPTKVYVAIYKAKHESQLFSTLHLDVK